MLKLIIILLRLEKELANPSLIRIPKILYG